jgi:predicted ArsR family transcriptional regulator
MHTRQGIQDYLLDHPYSYAEELSEALSKTRANIQYHLKRLAADGLITPVTPFFTTPERGRPRQYYALSPREKPDNLTLLAGALLRLYLDLSPDQEIDPDKLAALAQAILLPKAPISSSTSRLSHQVKELTARGYQARWEAHAGGPEIIFRNCPYAALIADHPELCQMDALLLKNNLGITFRQISKIKLPTTAACRFIIDPTRATRNDIG